MAAETPQMKNALASAERRGNSAAEITEGGWPFLAGVPMVKITVAASELINTGNYSNVTIGPIQVTRFVADGTDEHLRNELSATQALCEQATAEERQTIQVLLRSNAARASQ